MDYGEKRVGLAISDPLGMIASPAGFIARRAGKRPPVAEIIRRAEALEARGFVLGLPLDRNGEETAWTREVRRVGDELGKRTGLPVRYRRRAIHDCGFPARRSRDGWIDTRAKGRRRCDGGGDSLAAMRWICQNNV